MPVSLKATPLSINKAPDEGGFPEQGHFRTGIYRSIKWVVAQSMGLVIISLVFGALTLSEISLQAIENVANDATSTEQILSWPNFRGPGAIGHAVQANPPLNWSVEESKNIIWKVEIPKPGMNSPVIW
jgi:hypothetical protein